MSHSFALNKQLQPSFVRSRPKPGEKQQPQRIRVAQENKLTGKNCFHYACDAPSLLMILELAAGCSSSILGVDNYLCLPSKSVPFVNLTSRKYALKLEQQQARDHMYSETDFDFSHSFDREEVQAARPVARNSLASINSKLKVNLKARMTPSSRPSEGRVEAPRKPVVGSKVAHMLKQPLEAKPKDSKSFLQIKPAAGSSPFSRTVPSQKSPKNNPASTRDGQDSSYSGPSRSFNSGSAARNTKLSLEFKLKMHGDHVFERQLERLKHVPSSDQACSSARRDSWPALRVGGGEQVQRSQLGEGVRRFFRQREVCLP